MTARRWYHTPIVFLFLIVALSCEEKIADNPVVEGPPKTFLWLFPDTTVGVGVSRQDMHWWGEDPDGLVVGFLFSFGIVTTDRFAPPEPDTLRYTWLTSNDSTIFFPLDTLFRRYLVVVRAVDNTFPGLPEQSVIRLYPSPYWDKNDNGVLDPTDEELPALPNAMDPKGAALTFPIRNTPPNIGFLPNPIDGSPLRQPDTTFTVATFAWKGSDFDGYNTLAAYRFALNDTSDGRWFTVPLRDTIVTLVVPRFRSNAALGEVAADVYGGFFLERRFLGEVDGLRLDALNVLYVQALDVAGEYSAAITMPSGTDHWYVRKPRSRMLVVSDYISFDAAAALGTYRSSLAALPGGEYMTLDYLDFGLGLTATEKSMGMPGRLVHPYIDPALVQTFLLYDEVLWYTDQFPSLGVAQHSLFTYMQNGGRVIFSTSFQTTLDPSGALRDFAPIDSISSVNLSPTRPPVPPAVAGDSRIPASFVAIPDSTDLHDPYPRLAFNDSPVIHSIFMRPVYRRSDARYIYHLQADTRVPARYLGSPNVAVVDGAQTIIFIGMPLHLLNNTDVGNPLGLTAFFERALTREFNPLQNVDRRIF
jgi:hypothetical protein